MSFARLGAVSAGAAFIGLVGVELAGCSSFSGASDATPESSVAADAPAANDGSDADLVDARDADTGLPFEVSTLVQVTTGLGSFSIEATEVTNKQFSNFKTAFGPEAGLPWTECAGKTTLGPDARCTTLSLAELDPVMCVDFCDAKSYCTSIGRSLCGAIGGGPISPSQAALANDDQWSRACRGPEGSLYPYGVAPAAGVCNTQDLDAATAPARPAQFKQCQGGEPGVFDMSGNAAEWENACAVQTDGGPLECLSRGGGFTSTAAFSSCAVTQFGRASSGFPEVGFRCCATP